jgi:hypothetical protein
MQQAVRGHDNSSRGSMTSIRLRTVLLTSTPKRVGARSERMC